MEICNSYDPDKVFENFKLVEFPICFVGLSTWKKIEVECNLHTSAYLKTMLKGNLVKFEEARNVSASHRAFDIEYIDNHNILITFKPTNECILGTKQLNNHDNIFVVDMRLIQVDGKRCCCNEFHAEIGRYYLIGRFEYMRLRHDPKTIDFGEAALNTKVKKQLQIQNESQFTTARLHYRRTVGFQVIPEIFNIKPYSSQEISVTVKPNSLKLDNHILFHITNTYNSREKSFGDRSELKTEDNSIPYIIAIKISVACQKKSRAVMIESLHILRELNPAYTYVDDELDKLKERKDKISKMFVKAKVTAKYNIGRYNKAKERDTCHKELNNQINSPVQGFGVVERKVLSIFDVFYILPQPTIVDFGQVALSSYAKQELTIKNNSMCNITINFFSCQYILYSEKRANTLKIKVKSDREESIVLFCFGHKAGHYSGVFEYSIDQKYFRKHAYTLQVGTATIMLSEKSLKFGMVTMESFVTRIPLRMNNNFNVAIDFKWSIPHDDIPFEVFPSSCCLPGHTSRMCDVTFKCKPTKAKLFEIDLYFQKEIVPIELNVVTRKLSIKFLRSVLAFNDVPLNLDTYEKVKLENSSREVAFFYVVEPLMPGFHIAPMSGVIGPKMIMTFNIILKVSYMIDFSFDLILKINNKENVVLPVNGNVVEPRINIVPKTIFLPRIPCNMSTYVQVVLQNTSSVKSELEILDVNDDNSFIVCENKGNEKHRISKFSIDGGQSKTVFIQVYGTYRREYDFFVPLRVNGLIGPPNSDPSSHDLRHYIEGYEKCYENNSKVKVKQQMFKEISFCRLVGVISLPQLEFSVENYEIRYNQNGDNSIKFTMRNISKLNLFITIITSKLMPNFSLNLLSDKNILITSENHIKFELVSSREAQFCLKFHPKGHGKFVSTALLYLDANMTISYYNLTFVGINETFMISSNTSRIIFPPRYVGTSISRTIDLTIDTECGLDSLSFLTNEDDLITVEFLSTNVLLDEHKKSFTLVRARLTVFSYEPVVSKSIVTFKHADGSCFNIEVKFCYTYCPLTLHADSFVTSEDNPYPYYPINTQTNIFNYMERCSKFIEKWLFYQGFRKELYPKIPDTLNAISSALSSQNKEKSKGINVSYLSFVRRIVGPLMKHVHKVTIAEVDETVKQVKEIYGTYSEIFNLLKSRGANLWALEPKFLLSYDQFVVFSEIVLSKNTADENFTKNLLNDEKLFERLNKQCWIDFVIQSYKVFVLDSCFFDCICVSSQPRDILNIIISWYNEQLQIQFNPSFAKDVPVKCINNITTDLSDGIAIISAFLNNCSFLSEHFSIYSKKDKCCCDSEKINNACLIIEAINLLRLNFPISSNDFLEPNFLQMLFLSINLYVVLPMFKPKDIIRFNPPLLKTSNRRITISPVSQESLTFSYILLDNPKNNFAIEKTLAGDNGKKVSVNVTYTANFVEESKSILLVHGYNKTRIFDTYVLFILIGKVETLTPLRKCKVVGPNYRQQKVDILVSSPFTTISTYRMYIIDTEPSLPLNLEFNSKCKFYVRRLNLIDKEITLSGIPKDSSQEVIEHKLYLHLICLDSQISNSWVWFKSDIGEFFIKVTTQPRCDIFIDTLYAKVDSWPLDPCSCGESCRCYRTTVVIVPHRNETMIKSFRDALSENASDLMMEIFDQLIESATGRIILGMLLDESGVNGSEVQHILRNETSFRITARSLEPRLEQVTLAQHTEATLALPITVPAYDKPEKYSVTFTSDCSMDVRTYKVFFVENAKENTSDLKVNYDMQYIF